MTRTKNLRGRGFAAVFAAGVSAGLAQAAPLPLLDVPAMTEVSELVVVGRVGAVRIRRGTAQATLMFTVKVDRVLKGTSGGVVAVRLAADGSAGVSDSQYGIFFLRRAAGGAYQPTDPGYPALVAVPDSTAGAAGDPLTDVAHELAQVLTARAASDTSQRFAEASEALQTIPYATAGAALRAAAAPHAPGRLWAIGAWFFMGSGESLDAIKVRYLESVKDDLIDPTPETRRAISRLAYAMQGRLGSARSVPTLAALLRSSASEVRCAAASVLGELKAPRAIRPLAELALNDADAEVRSQAMTALTDIVGHGPDAADEANALRYWRQWAKANLR
jgi:hypothetical protein